MFYRFISACLVIGFLPMAAGAQDIAQPPDAQLAAPQQKAQPAARTTLELATIRAPGEVVARGDIIQISRGFGAWTLSCEIRLSKNTRVCAADQGAQDGPAFLRMRIAPNVEKKPVAIMMLPASFKPENGLRLFFSGLEKTLDKDMFKCTPSICVGGFPFEGLLQASISSSSSLGIDYSITDPAADGGKRDVRLSLSMDGFADVLAAAAGDPFGREISEKVAQQQDIKPAKPKRTPPKKPAAKARESGKAKTPTTAQPETSAPASDATGLF